MFVWMFNFYLYWFYLNLPPVYEILKAAGAPCYVKVDSTYLPTMGLGFKGDEPPVCFYDPSAR